jgi:Phage Mu protein F like protein
MLNSAQFSSAKSVAENGMMKSVMYDDKGVRKSFSAFKADCKAITDISNDTWLRTEYDTSLRTAIAGQQFRSFEEDKDLYGYWLYLETSSAHPREEHLELVGNIYKIGDPESDDVFPPNGFNCSCGAEQIDDQYLQENGKTPRTNEEAKEDLINGVPEQFRFNPGKQGILPRQGHSYFQALGSANEADSNMFSDLE